MDRSIFKVSALISAACIITGCKPSIQIQPATEGETTEVPQSTEPLEVQAESEPYSSTPKDTALNTPTQTVTVLTDPWSKYFQSDPTIIILPKLTKGVKALLDEQQVKAKEILSNPGKLSDRPEYIQLEEELEQLKTAVPGAETRSGYSRSSNRYYSAYPYSYVSSDGSIAYVRSRNSSGSYYTVFNQVHKSSSPALARSVENIIYNATLEDLDQRVEAMHQINRTWSRKTNVMSPNGVEGVMREANLAYLASFKDYTSDFVKLQNRLKRVQSLIDAEKTKKEERLAEWQAFEANRLPVIEEYITRQHLHKVTAEAGNFQIPSNLNQTPVILLACKIGTRTLYFDLSHGTHRDHPFRLVSLGE
jgi:hypothetical protein